ELDMSIIYLDNKVNGTEIPDSLQYNNMKKKLLVIKPDERGPIRIQQRNMEEKKGLLEKAKDSFKDFFNKTKDKVNEKIDSAQSKYDKIKEFDTDSLDFEKMLDPKNLLPNQDSTDVSDSTNTKQMNDSLKTEPKNEENTSEKEEIIKTPKKEPAKDSSKVETPPSDSTKVEK